MTQTIRVGLGTFQFSNVFSRISEKTADSIVRVFLDLGGRYIDTAPKYGLGEVEEELGQILRGIPRERYAIATKCGIVWDDPSHLRLSGKFDDVIADCENSLRRLRVDHIDLYISHAPDAATPYEETMEAMLHLQKQGKIADIGVSNVSLEQLQKYNHAGAVRFVQNRLSLLNQDMDAAFYRYCAEHDIGITAYMVIERGLLTGKIMQSVDFKPGDLRNEMEEFRSDRREVIGIWVRNHLKPVAEELDVEVSQLAISWVLHQPSTAFCICGATSIDQVEKNQKAALLQLTPEILHRIDHSYQLLVDQIKRNYGLSLKGFLLGPVMPELNSLVNRGVRRRTDYLQDS